MILLDVPPKLGMASWAFGEGVEMGNATAEAMSGFLGMILIGKSVANVVKIDFLVDFWSFNFGIAFLRLF